MFLDADGEHFHQTFHSMTDHKEKLLIIGNTGIIHKNSFVQKKNLFRYQWMKHELKLEYQVMWGYRSS